MNRRSTPPDARPSMAGVLQATGGLSSTKTGARIRFEGGKHRVIDGPFAESKELIAGYAIVDLPSKAAAIEWAIRFGDIVEVNEVVGAIAGAERRHHE